MTYAISSAEIVAMRADGLSHAAIGRRVNMSTSAVRDRLKKSGEPPRQPSRRCLEAVAAYRKHGSIRAAGEAVGVSKSSIHRALLRYKRLTGETLVKQQELSPRRLEAVAAYRKHGTFGAAARAIGMDKRSLHKAVRRYEHLTGETIQRAQ